MTTIQATFAPVLAALPVVLTIAHTSAMSICGEMFILR